MKISKAFKLKKNQSELDFIDVDTSFDLKLFVDPYAIEISEDPLALELQNYIVTYFEVLLETIRSGSASAAASLTSHLSEPRETFLGVSKGSPAGRGVGPNQARQIISALKRSKSFQTGTLTDLAETELFIDGISSDKLSDLTTNVIRSPLERYTLEQCQLHDIPTHKIAMPPSWNPTKGRWETHYANIPIVGKYPVLFIPKVLVRRKLSLDSQEFYNHHMLNFLQQEEIRTGGSLVNLLKNGTKKVYKSDLKEVHPFAKPDLEAFARANPDVIERYKQIKGAQGALTARDFDEDFVETAFALALKDGLAKIPAGRDHADEYHAYMVGVLSFLFYPHLVTPKKEDPLHDGRKRIDITYTNASKDGFFSAVRSWPPASTLYLFVECKNYTGDVKNPELDQLSSRFGHQRGNLGFLVCRQIQDRVLFTQRCKDTASDKRGYVIALDDSDFAVMLDLVAQLKRAQISAFLDAKLRAIV
ncbi:hypothetical protein [Caulobacter sp. BE254]|uniref:hypothetical protein n=1 Tax=Caulobacter sp. BE254 TaxID=2817720 RepID=UPI00285FE9FB|nr:hypothetical protein [Caulobacter sp. BE254]MDR7117403.1 hypothetical protein [Caulobacter sp. BE254]